MAPHPPPTLKTKQKSSGVESEILIQNADSAEPWEIGYERGVPRPQRVFLIECFPRRPWVHPLHNQSPRDPAASAFSFFFFLFFFLLFFGVLFFLSFFFFFFFLFFLFVFPFVFLFFFTFEWDPKMFTTEIQNPNSWNVSWIQLNLNERINFYFTTKC